MIYNNILEAMGHTPMIRLNRMTDEDCAEILVKFEAVNVGGSIKTRTALNMILDAEKKEIIKEDTIIVEPTSGNQGIGLALVGAVRGYKTVIIMPDSVSEERRKLVKQYGADIRVVHDEGDIGKCINDCIQMAMDMKAEDPRVFVPQQFENMANYQVHFEKTGAEIVEQVGKKIDGFCSGPLHHRLPFRPDRLRAGGGLCQLHLYISLLGGELHPLRLSPDLPGLSGSLHHDLRPDHPGPPVGASPGGE